MDDQQIPGMQSRDPMNTAGQSMRDAGETVKNATDSLTQTASDTVEQARSMARNASEQVWSAAATAGTRAQDLARQAREQTAIATDTLYQQGSRAGEILARNVNEYPLTALLLAGVVGYSMAYLIHRNWQA